jgi:hypothetical protein
MPLWLVSTSLHRQSHRSKANLNPPQKPKGNHQRTVMSTRPQKSAPAEGGNKKHRQTPYNKNRKGKAGAGGGPHPGNANAGGVPGVSKIKGQIRQTTRLLAKVSLSDTRFTQMKSDSTVPFRFKGQSRASIACANGEKTDVAAGGSC